MLRALLLATLLIPVMQPDTLSAKTPPRRHTRAKPAAAKFNPDQVNDAATTTPVGPRSSGSAVLRAEILLDRAHFSPGEIDGHYGDNLRLAITAFQSARGLHADGVVHADAWKVLNSDTAPALVPYTIAEPDVAGPFETVPKDIMEQAKLKTLGYESALEAFGERFHSSPHLLTTLNPGKDFNKAGEQILVPNTVTESAGKASTVVVHKSTHAVEVLDSEGKVIAHYPATMGSEHDPLPIGDWKITRINRNPEFNYNPALFWDSEPSDKKARIAPGPNNPAGLVWINLSKEHYGIHGTPEPSTIGKTQSHGCIRLTNWDALELASLVAPGTPAVLQEQ